MSIHHRLEAEELADTSLYELYSVLGERDTPKLYDQPYRIDVDHDCPTGAGNSLDRKTKYVDRVLYQELMDNAFVATGLSPMQILFRWLDHEHCEKCIVDGENPADTYAPAHDRGLRKEHEGVIAILTPRNAKETQEVLQRYEETIWPAIMRCYHRPITKPPVDLWCGPLLDAPTGRDKEILEALRRYGVIDAGKRSKASVHYQIGPSNCEDCRNWHPDFMSEAHGELAACSKVNGLVRHNRTCDLWIPKTESRGG